MADVVRCYADVILQERGTQMGHRVSSTSPFSLYTAHITAIEQTLFIYLYTLNGQISLLASSKRADSASQREGRGGGEKRSELRKTCLPKYIHLSAILYTYIQYIYRGARHRCIRAASFRCGGGGCKLGNVTKSEWKRARRTYIYKRRRSIGTWRDREKERV